MMTPFEKKYGPKKAHKYLMTDKTMRQEKFNYVDALKHLPRSFEYSSEEAYSLVNRVAFRQNFKTLMNHFADSK